MIKVIKIKVLLLVAATLLATSLGAKQVSEDGARAIAQSYVVKATTKKMPVQAGTASETRLKMAYAAQNEALDTDYYVFNNCEEGGYIIVSGDDRAVPVLGYCDRDEFDPENVPGGLQSLLYGYSQEIEFLRGSSLTAKASAPPVRWWALNASLRYRVVSTLWWPTEKRLRWW